MSRFAKIPVKIPESVKIEFTSGNVKVTGPKGTLERKFPDIIDIKISEGNLTVSSKEKVPTKFGESIKGTLRSHIVNMVTGAVDGWSKKLEISGTGYRAEVKDSNLVLTVGFSHSVTLPAPLGIKFEVVKNIITVDGIDKEVVGSIAAKIRAVRPPDPYKGKGIRYLGEVLKLKPGKQAAKTAA